MEKVITHWADGKAQYQEGLDVTPSYSRSGGRVVKIGERFIVPRIDEQYPSEWFNTLAEAWNYCESAYYSNN